MRRQAIIIRLVLLRNAIATLIIGPSISGKFQCVCMCVEGWGEEQLVGCQGY